MNTGRNYTIIALNEFLSVGSLHPYYIYNYQVAAYTIGIGPYSEPFSLQTLESGMLF